MKKVGSVLFVAALLPLVIVGCRSQPEDTFAWSIPKDDPRLLSPEAEVRDAPPTGQHVKAVRSHMAKELSRLGIARKLDVRDTGFVKTVPLYSVTVVPEAKGNDPFEFILVGEQKKIPKDQVGRLLKWWEKDGELAR